MLLAFFFFFLFFLVLNVGKKDAKHECDTQEAAEWHTMLFLKAQIMLIHALLTGITLTQCRRGRRKLNELK